MAGRGERRSLVVVMPYGGEVEEGAGELSYYSDVGWSSVDQEREEP